MTNDSDLVEPVRIVREELALPVGILNPHRRPSQALRRVASFVKPIRKGVLGASQLPATIEDRRGAITKPEAWCELG